MFPGKERFAGWRRGRKGIDSRTTGKIPKENSWKTRLHCSGTRHERRERAKVAAAAEAASRAIEER